jgi:hypothetical protein
LREFFEVCVGSNQHLVSGSRYKSFWKLMILTEETSLKEFFFKCNYINWVVLNVSLNEQWLVKCIAYNCTIWFVHHLLYFFRWLLNPSVLCNISIYIMSDGGYILTCLNFLIVFVWLSIMKKLRRNHHRLEFRFGVYNLPCMTLS